MAFNFLFIKEMTLVLIFAVAIFYQVILFCSLWKKRKTIDFTSGVIKPNGTVSKSGITFYILILVVVYQALFANLITPGLIEMLGLILAADLGGKYIENHKFIELGKIKKSTSKEQSLSSDEFKDL